MLGLTQRLRWVSIGSEPFFLLACLHAGFEEGAAGKKVAALVVTHKSQTKANLSQKLSLGPDLPLLSL